MRAMVFDAIGKPLTLRDLPIPIPSANQLLIRVKACGICRTDLHIYDGELQNPLVPLILGHQIVGVVDTCGSLVKNFHVGQRVGVPWLGQSCGSCSYCSEGQENLCDNARYTGYHLNGGLAEYCVANSEFCFHIPDSYDDLQAAPLLCAGLIGYRALRKVADAQNIGFYGFGASAHILAQFVTYQKRKFYAFTREGDSAAQRLARELGAIWAGSSSQTLDFLLDAAIIFAPDGTLVPIALKNIRKGGIVVCAGIHMTDIPSFPYKILWGERQICSIANLTKNDGEEFFKVAPLIPVKTKVHTYPLEKANEALDDLRRGKFSGAAVIEIYPGDADYP